MIAFIRDKLYLQAVVIAVTVIAAAAASADDTGSNIAVAHHAFLKGPWEIAVTMGMDGMQVQFPIKVSSENKPEKLGSVLPVMGTPIKIRLEQYVPDLKLETTTVKDSAGGIVAKLVIKGDNFSQDIWLSTNDAARQSISSSIGSVAIKELHNAGMLTELSQKINGSKAVGILSVWLKDANSPLEYLANPGETIIIPHSKYKLSIAEYIPNYSIDTKTKKIISQSDEPLNPAIKVNIDDGEHTYEQWLWAKFPSFSHDKNMSPLRMEFTEIDTGDKEGKYMLLAASSSEALLIFSKDGKTEAEKVELGKFYPFANKDYSFAIENITEGAIVKTNWRNNSENLLHPAIIAMVESDGAGQEAVLEFNKPCHQKTKFGTIVILYRSRSASAKATN